MNNKWCNSILNNPERMGLPIMTNPGIEFIHKHVIDAVTNGEIHYQAIKALIDTYKNDSCTVIMDLTVEAEAFGAKINFSPNDVPAVSERLVHDEETINQLKIPDLNTARIPEYLKANRLVVENYPEINVFSGCIGPFSLAARLFDMSEIMMSLYIEPETIKILLDKCNRFILKYCESLKKLGVTGVIMAEPAAGLLSNEDCQVYSSYYVKRIVDELQDENFAIVMHNCGNSGQCTQAMIDTGACALHFGNTIDMVETLKLCPSETIVMGNLDPVIVFQQSAPEEVYNQTLKLLNDTSTYKNFVLSTGCDVPPNVSDDNIKAFYRALDDFNMTR